MNRLDLRPIRGARAGLLAALVACAALASPGAAIASPPTIASESVSNITATSATLEAQIDPNLPLDDDGGVYYQFQLVAQPQEFWPEVTCPEQRPEGPLEAQCFGPYGTVGGPPPVADIQRRPGDLPTERLAAFFGSQSVRLDLSDIGRELQPGTTYHYRVLAAETGPLSLNISWESPPTYGDDETFTTAGSKPVGEGTVEPQSPTGSPTTPAGLPATVPLVAARLPVPQKCLKRQKRRATASRRHGRRTARHVCLRRSSRVN